MLKSDVELETTLKRIAWFQRQLAHLRNTESNEAKWYASSAKRVNTPGETVLIAASQERVRTIEAL